VLVVDSGREKSKPRKKERKEKGTDMQKEEKSPLKSISEKRQKSCLLSLHALLISTRDLLFTHEATDEKKADNNRGKP